MIENDRYAKIAASRLRRAWREGHVRLGSASRSSIAAAEQALRARRRRRILVRRVVPVVASSMAAAGLLLGWLSLGDRRSPPPVSAVSDHRALVVFGAGVHRGPSPAPAAERALGAGDQVFAPRTEPVHLGDVAGTLLTLESGGSLTVVEAGATRRFALRRGAVSARVRKLAAGERFIIDTTDAEIEVHGTEFRVELGAPEAVPCPGPGPSDVIATRVTVQEGVVTVKWAGDDQRLRPGDEWPPRCAAATPGRVAAAKPIAKLGARVPVREAPASALEAQNDLYVSASNARRRGHPVRALALFERFIREYPGAALFESALAQKMRLLAAMPDPRGAAAAARQYLARFPDGFAGDEARILLGAPAGP